METAAIVLSDSLMAIVIVGGVCIRHYMVKHYLPTLDEYVHEHGLNVTEYLRKYRFSMVSMLVNR